MQLPPKNIFKMRKAKLRIISSDQYYKDFYPLILRGGSVGRVAQWTHRSLEQIPNNWPANFNNVLEIGAGNGEHFSYVSHNFQSYLETDLRIEVLKSSTKERELDARVIQEQLSANNLAGIPSNSIDRVILTCVLIHLDNPNNALAEIRRIVRNNGVISIYVPCEPGLMLRVIRYLTTARRGRRLGINHLYFHYTEHKFHFLYLKEVIRKNFETDEVQNKKYPFKFLSWNFNLWNIYQVNIFKNQ